VGPRKPLSDDERGGSAPMPPFAKAMSGAGLMVVGLLIWLRFTGVLALAGQVLSLFGWIVLASWLLSNQTRYFRIFNVAVRVAGVCFTIGGLVIMFDNLSALLHPEQSTGKSNGVEAIFVGCLPLCIGVGLLLARATRPDLGDGFVSDRVMRIVRGLPSNWGRPVVPGRESRTWWTGDSKPKP